MENKFTPISALLRLSPEGDRRFEEATGVIENQLQEK